MSAKFPRGGGGSRTFFSSKSNIANVFPFKCSFVYCSFVLGLVHGIYNKVSVKVSRVIYVSNHLSESIHI